MSESELWAGERAHVLSVRTGAPLSVHTMFLYSGRDGGLRIARELEPRWSGSQPRGFSAIRMPVVERTLVTSRELLRLGLILEYDVFGFEMGFVADGVAA